MFRKALYGAVALTALMVGGAQAEDLKEFRIGLIGGENEADRLRNFQCLVDKLPAVLGVEKVSLFPAADYDGTIQGLLGGTLDYAELGASGYAKIYLENKDAVEPILTTVQTDGSTGYYSIMVATKAFRHQAKLADLKGKKLGFADPDSTSGYLIPVTALPKDLGGVAVKDYFAETGFGGGHENLVLEVLKGTFDAGTTFGSGVGEFEGRLHLRQPRQDGRQGHPRHGRPGRNLEVAADPERPDRRSHLARRRHQDEVQAVHGRPAEDRHGMLLGHPGRRLHRLHRSDAGILPAHHRRPQGADRLVSQQATRTRRGPSAARLALTGSTR